MSIISDLKNEENIEPFRELVPLPKSFKYVLFVQVNNIYLFSRYLCKCIKQTKLYC